MSAGQEDITVVVEKPNSTPEFSELSSKAIEQQITRLLESGEAKNINEAKEMVIVNFGSADSMEAARRMLAAVPEN